MPREPKIDWEKVEAAARSDSGFGYAESDLFTDLRERVSSAITEALKEYDRQRAELPAIGTVRHEMPGGRS